MASSCTRLRVGKITMDAAVCYQQQDIISQSWDGVLNNESHYNIK